MIRIETTVSLQATLEKIRVPNTMYKGAPEVVDLNGKVCLVTGGSRGIGRGIALELAYHGAKCYVTGRDSEALGVLKEQVKEKGRCGEFIPVKCDHSIDDEVKEVFERIRQENDGRLDLLVNNAYSAIQPVMDSIGTPFWEQSHDSWDKCNHVGLRNHYLCAMQAAKMMVERRQGLIINISSIGGLQYLFSVPYGIGKAAKDRMAADCAEELKKYKVAFVSLWPGLVKTEKLMNTLKYGKLKSKSHDYFVETAETENYVGRIVAALLSETQLRLMQRTGKVMLTTDVGREYGIVDEYGQTPTSMFQLNYILNAGGYHRLSNCIPNFIRFPMWFIQIGNALRK